MPHYYSTWKKKENQNKQLNTNGSANCRPWPFPFILSCCYQGGILRAALWKKITKHPYGNNKYFVLFLYTYILGYSKILSYDTVINLQLAVHYKICSCKITQTDDLKSIHICLFRPVLHISGEGHSDNNIAHMGGLLQESQKLLATNLCSFNIPAITKWKRWKGLCFLWIHWESHINLNSNISMQHLFLPHQIFWNKILWQRSRFVVSFFFLWIRC